MSTHSEERKLATIMFTDIGGLKLMPFWDPLRGDPAFQKLCEEKQP